MDKKRRPQDSNRYLLPKTDRQIASLLSMNNSFTYYRLCLTIAKFIKKNNYYDFLYHLFKYKTNDSEIYRKIKPFIKRFPTLKDSNQSYSATSSAKLVMPLKDLVDESGLTVSKYLDFGCGKCDMTQWVGAALGLERSSVYGTDVKDEFEPTWDSLRANNNQINFEYIVDGRIPFDVRFDVVTCFMVLHHIKDPVNTIQNIYNSLSDGGFLYIREHDCVSDEDKTFADLIHSLYIIQNDGDIERVHSQVIYYKSASEWKRLLSEVGLVEVYFRDDPFSVSKNYRAIYKKVAL